jgi:two-component system, sensor histidine kinase and response regulator
MPTDKKEVYYDYEPEFSAARPDLLALEGLQLHRSMLKVITGFAVFYCLMNLIVENYAFFIINLVVIPGFMLSWWIDKKFSTYISKIWTLLVINANITAVAVVAGAETYNFLFFIPIIIGSLIIFQGREVASGYVMTAFSIFLLSFTTFTDIKLGHMIVIPADELWIEQASNIFGVCVVVIIQMRFMITVSRDIQKKMFRNALALEKSNSRLSTTLYTRDKMMSVLTHDLRSPVVTIHSGLELIQSGQLHPSFQEKTMGQIVQKSKAVVQLIDKILLWSRSQTEQINYQETLITGEQVRQMIRSTCDLLQSDKLIHFQVNIQLSNTTSVRCDVNMIEAVLRNLISNAIKYSPPGSEVLINATEVEEHVNFEVTDNGKGMTADEVNLLRQGVSFSTLGTQKEQGHGIGVPLVIDFLQRHGTALHIWSEVEKGSTFSFALRKQM